MLRRKIDLMRLINEGGPDDKCHCYCSVLIWRGGPQTYFVYFFHFDQQYSKPQLASKSTCKNHLFQWFGFLFCSPRGPGCPARASSRRVAHFEAKPTTRFPFLAVQMGLGCSCRAQKCDLRSLLFGLKR